jgi:hypothetical protein
MTHIESCYELLKWGVTDKWEFKEYDIVYTSERGQYDKDWDGIFCACNEYKDMVEPLDGRELRPYEWKKQNCIIIGGDRFTNFCVEWLRERKYHIDPSPNGYYLMKPNGTHSLLKDIDTFTEALVSACVWVLKEGK